MITYPNSKINIGLKVINKRLDGFHTIESVFYPIAFSDSLECVENKQYANENKCVFVSHGLKIAGKNDTNLVVKAYAILDQLFDLPPVLFYLYKQIPMGAGLGGGSSDAAYALKLLNELFKLSLSTNELKQHAASLGSDCAFFIDNKPAYLLGRGPELTTTLFSLKGYYLVLINTGVHSNTALAYQHVKPRGIFDETQTLLHALQQPVELWKNTITNDFEYSVFKSFSELKHVKQWLYNQGAFYASMSGSGASMYGLFKQKPKLSGKWVSKVVFEGELTA